MVDWAVHRGSWSVTAAFLEMGSDEAFLVQVP
jgi:hypothetical protein